MSSRHSRKLLLMRKQFARQNMLKMMPEKMSYIRMKVTRFLIGFWY
jgi:hypothetical protein